MVQIEAQSTLECPKLFELFILFIIINIKIPKYTFIMTYVQGVIKQTAILLIRLRHQRLPPLPAIVHVVVVVVIVLVVGLAHVLLVGGGWVASVAVIGGAKPRGPEVVEALPGGRVSHQRVQVTAVVHWGEHLK